MPTQPANALTRLSILVAIALALPLNASGETQQSTEVLLDRCNDVSTWSVDPGGEFPGAKGNLTIVTDPTVGQCVRLEYDFTGGGAYVTAAREFDVLDVPFATAVSLSIRQEGKNHGFIRVCDASDQEHAGGFAIAGDGWQRVVIPLDLAHLPGHWHGPDDGKFHFPLNRIIIGVTKGETKQGAVLLKDLCVFTTEKSMRCGISIKTPDPGNVVFTKNGNAAVTVQIENRVAEPSTVDLRLSVEDWRGARRSLPVESLSLPSRGVIQRTLSLDARQPSYYRISGEILQGGRPRQVGAQDWAGVVITHKPPNFGFDDPQSFFAIQATSDGARTERLGVKWVRAGGDADFLQRVRRNHQLVMYLLHHDTYREENRDQSHIEKWANGPVEATVRETSRYVDTYEIQNEPDLTCMYQVNLSFEAGLDLYLKILRAASEAVRRVAPRARIAGIDVSGGDYDGGLKYSEAAMARAGNLIDVYTGHPYAGVRYYGEGQQPMWPVRNEERRKCLDTLEMIRRHGGKQHFWVGEKGWGLHVKTDPLSGYSRDFARCLVQSMVIAHSVPSVERYFWFIEEGCNEGGYEYGLFRKGKPLPAALAYATLAWMLHHAKPYRSPDMGATIQAHCFVSSESHNGTLVMWSEGDRSTVSVGSIPTDWSAFDMMGHRVANGLRGKELRLSLDRSPVYVRFNASAADAVCSALTRATITCSEPVKIETAYLTSLKHLNVRLKNVTPQPVKCELTTDRFRGAVKVSGNQLMVVTLAAPNDLLSRPRDRIPVRLTVRGNTVTFNARADLIACPRMEDAKMNGDLTSWESREGFVLNQRTQVLPPDPGVGWNGPEDLNAKAWIAWDDHYLYFTARVHDKIHFVDNAEVNGFWNSDSVQIAIDPLNDATPTAGYDANDVEVGLVLAKDGPRAYMTVPRMRRIDVPCWVSRRDEDTVYQIAIPWTLTGVRRKSGDVLGLNFILNQNNGNGRAYWMGLTPGIGEAKRPWVFKRIYLSPANPDP